MIDDLTKDDFEKYVTPAKPTRQREFRTDRNNNPIAAAVTTGGRNQFTDALDQAEIPWEHGDVFPGNPKLSTIKIKGDPYEGARAILGNSNALKWYRGTTGKQILPKYGVRSSADFTKLPIEHQNDIINGIYQSEGGRGLLKPSQDDFDKYVSSDTPQQSAAQTPDDDFEKYVTQEPQQPLSAAAQGGVKGIPQPKEQVTSTVREADTGTELPSGPTPQPKPVAPVQFQQGTGLRAPTGIADYLATKSEIQQPRNAAQEPGAGIRLPFSPDTTPSRDDVERAVIRSYGPQYEALNDQYRKESKEKYGQTENLVKLPQEAWGAMKREPDGSVMVGASQGAVDYLNAYAKNGIAGVEALQKPGAHAFEPAPPKTTMEKIGDAGSNLLQSLNIDTPGGLKSDLPRGVAHAVTLGAVGEPREISREEKILNPQAEATANLSRGVGEAAGALLPFVAAGKILAPLELAKPVQTAAQFGLVDAGKQAVNLAKGRPVDWTSPIVSAGIGTAIGHLEGADPGTIRKVVAFIAPQLAVDAATGVPREQAVQNALTNMAFALGGGDERLGPDARTPEVQSREALGIERAAKEGLTPEEREAKVQPYFLRDDQGNPVARVLNPDEVAAGTEKMRVRAIHPADTAARDEGGRFAEKPPQPEVLSEPLRQPVPEQVAATEAPLEQPTEQPNYTVPQTTPEGIKSGDKFVHGAKGLTFTVKSIEGDVAVLVNPENGSASKIRLATLTDDLQNGTITRIPEQPSAAVSPQEPLPAASTPSPDKGAATASSPTTFERLKDLGMGDVQAKGWAHEIDNAQDRGEFQKTVNFSAKTPAARDALMAEFDRAKASTAPTVAAPKPEPISNVEATGIPSSPEPSVREPLARREFVLPKAEVTRPLAAEGLTSYRYRPENGSHIAIGAKNDAEALAEAARSLSSGKPEIAKLDVWDGEKYVPVTSAEPSEASARPALDAEARIQDRIKAEIPEHAPAGIKRAKERLIRAEESPREAQPLGKEAGAAKLPQEDFDRLLSRGWDLYDQKIKPTFEEWAKKLRDEFGAIAEDHLKPIWNQLTQRTEPITSIKNAAVESRREALELPNLTPADHQSWEEAGIKARERGLDTPDKADAIAEQVNNGTKRQLTVEESAGLRDRIRGIENDYQKLAKQTEGESDPEKLAELKADGDVLRERYRILTDASKKAGTDIARALAIRRSAVDQDMLLTQLGAEQSYKLTTGKEPTAEVQKQIKDLVDENTRLKTQLDEHEEARKLKAQEKDLNKVIVEKKIEIRRAGRKRAHDDLVKERADIKQQIAAAWKKVGSSNIYGASAIDPEGELSRALGDLARNYIEDGVIKAADIVDAIHEQIKDVADLSKRQVSDLISGYGKVKESIRDPVERKLNEVKSILASTSGKADVLEQGIRPLRRGQQREKPTEDQRRALRELEDAMRQKGPELANQPYDVRTEQASPLDKAKTTARNRQEQLKKWIADGKREVNGRQQIIPDAELKQIKAENAALEKVVALLNDPAADQKAIELRVDALNRQLVKARSRITSGETGPQVREGAKSAWSPEIATAMKERDALNRIASDLRAAEARKAKAAEKSKPTGIYGVEGSWADFEARAKKALASRARMEKQIAEYQRKIKEQDFSTKPRPEPVLDREGNALRAKLEQVARNFNRLKEKNNDTTVLDALARWKRFAVLTYGTTVGKLTAAASGRMAATPLYESMGQIGKRVMPKTFAEEPNTRGFLKGEKAAVKQLWQSDSFRDFLSHLKGGDDLISLLYGEAGGDEFLKSSSGKTFLPRTVGEVMDRPGHLHAALKTVPKRAAFFRYFERALDAEANKSNPRDIRDPMVQLEIAGEAKAHQEAQRAILQQKNPITEIFNNIIRRTSQSKYRTARLIGKALQFEFPITKVPANYVGEVATHIAGLPAGLGEVAGRTVANRVVRPLLKTEAQTRIGEIRRGLEKRLPQAVSELEPEQRQRIARAIKVGGVGLGFVVWGAMRPDQFGGYYQPGKRDPSDVKFGGMRFMGINIPRWMGHIPPLEAAQFGATIRRVSDSLRAKQQTKTEAITGGVKEAVKGLGEEVPFIDTLMNPMHGVGALVGKEGERQKYVGGELRSLIPGLGQQGAKALDYPEGTSFTQRLNPFSNVEPTSRKPESIGQEAEMGIPFLRQTVPISKVFGARPTKASGEVQRLDVSIPGIVKQPDESAREFALRQARVNPYIRKTLEAVVNSPEYDKASDADKTEWLKQAAAGGRRAGEANEPEKPEKPEKKEFPIPEVPRPLSRSRNPFANRFMTNRASQSV